MKSSVLAFVITGAQLGVIIWGAVTHPVHGIYGLLTSYSPVYMVRALLAQENQAVPINALYFVMIGYHLIKYFIIFRANTYDESNYFKLFALAFEVMYLIYSGYLLF